MAHPVVITAQVDSKRLEYSTNSSTCHLVHALKPDFSGRTREGRGEERRGENKVRVGELVVTR